MAAEGVLIFDSCAVLALLRRESGASRVIQLLQEHSGGFIHGLNACEIYYDLYRSDGEHVAGGLSEVLQGLGLEIVENLPGDLWQLAGQLKAVWRRISLADCVALALAMKNEGTLVTSDHHEFDRIAEADLCPMLFIR